MCDDSVNQNINEIYVNTGNLLESEELKRNITVLPGQEIYEGLRLTLEAWKQDKTANERELTSTRLLILNDQLQNKKSIDRSNYKVNIKVFLFNNNKDELEHAIKFVRDQLSINEIDSLTLSFTPDEQQTNLELIKPLWSVLENKTKDELLEIGVSDLNTQELISLFNGSSKIKPMFNQINLDSCCTIPPEMSEFAKQNNIRLLTHNDPRDVLNKDKVCELFGCKNVEKNNWQRKWLIRYSIISRNKGIIQTKGYILFVARN